MPLPIMKWVMAGVGLIFLFLFVRRSMEVGVGPAAGEVGKAIGTFGESLGAVGSGVGQLGLGFSTFLKSTLDPFGLLSKLLPNPNAGNANKTSAPAGIVGGFNVVQSTVESTPEKEISRIPGPGIVGDRYVKVYPV